MATDEHLKWQTDARKAAIYRSWRSGIRIAPAPVQPTRMASASELSSPIPSRIVESVCSRDLIIDLFPPIFDSPRNYRRLLRDLNVPRRHWFYNIIEMTPNHFFLILASALFVTIFISWMFSGCNSLVGGCESISLETKTSIGSTYQENDKQPQSVIANQRYVSPARTINETKKISDDGLLNITILATYGTMIAFLYAVFQWRMENRQSSINELFQRKKDINFLLLEKPEIRILLKEAVDRKLEHGQTTLTIDLQRSIDVINKIQSSDYLDGIEEFTFDQKMFAFIEIDNLEFAIEKYVSGYLDDSQMYRACEIFQSRCFSRAFRYLAVTQGLAYYKDSLRDVLASIAIRGHFYEFWSQEIEPSAGVAT